MGRGFYPVCGVRTLLLIGSYWSAPDQYSRCSADVVRGLSGGRVPAQRCGADARIILGIHLRPQVCQEALLTTQEARVHWAPAHGCHKTENDAQLTRMQRSTSHSTALPARLGTIMKVEVIYDSIAVQP